MRAFGLNIEWCLEFLRKQSTIGNLSEGNYDKFVFLELMSNCSIAKILFH